MTDLNIEGPVPNQTCMFGQLRELDLDGGAMTGTIPFFLTQCFPFVNEIDLSYNQVGAPHKFNNHVNVTYACDSCTGDIGLALCRGHPLFLSVLGLAHVQARMMLLSKRASHTHTQLVGGTWVMIICGQMCHS